MCATPTSTPPRARTRRDMRRRVLGHEGAGVVERVGEDVTMVSPGDHVVTLFSPQCGECVHCLSPRTNLCLAIRDLQGKGYLPDGTDPALARRRGDSPLHGHLDLRRVHGDAGDRARARSTRRRRSTGRCLFACGLSTGLGAAINTAGVEPGSTCVVFGAGMVGLGAVAGCRLQGAERIVCVDLSRGPPRARARPGRHRHAGRRAPTRSTTILEMTGGFGADYTFEATGLVRGHAPGGRGGPDGLGPRHRRRRGGQGRDARRDPALAHHRAPDRRLVVRRRQGPRSACPR